MNPLLSTFIMSLITVNSKQKKGEILLKVNKKFRNKLLGFVLPFMLLVGCGTTAQEKGQEDSSVKVSSSESNEEVKDKKAGQDNRLPNVQILATGGTIAGGGESNTSTTDYKAGEVGVDELIKAVPEMKEIANVDGEQVVNIGSADVTNEILLKLGKRVNELLASDKVDGIVITHGTDTLEETAYFLNLVVKSDKPVVVVGAMRPATAISADGPLNLYNAVKVASSKEARGKGTMIVLNDRIASARYVTKTNTTAPDTFKAEEMGYLGTIADNVYFNNTITRKHTTETDFDISTIEKLPQVDILYGHQNEGTYLFKAAVDAGSKGIVYAGSGNGSMSEVADEAAKEAEGAGVEVIRSSRTGNGVVTPKDYISANSLNPQKARILLMLSLTKTENKEKIQKYFDEY